MEEQLEKKLKEILQLTREFNSYYLTNEIAVREQLINPILNALGWNTANPNYVRHNAPNDLGKIPDYTLVKNKKNSLVVEAKNLSIELKDDRTISQLAGYAYNMGISFGILTNGLKWLLFNTFQRNPSERIVWIVDLEKEESLNSTVKKLISIAYENIEKLESSIQRIKILESLWTSICPNQQELIKLLSDTMSQKIKKQNPNTTIEMLDIEGFVESKISELFEVTIPQRTEISNSTIQTEEVQTNSSKKAKTLLKVSFPDGTTFSENMASETFIKAIEKIGVERVRTLGLTLSGIPLVDNKKDTFYRQYETSNGLFIMIHSDTKNKIKRLQEISKRLNLNLLVEEKEWKR